MRNADNENEELPFQTLAAITRRLLPTSEQNEQPTEHGGGRDEGKGEGKAHRDYVEQRLRELARFERRANGGKKPVRRDA